ncbi:MULTISPECIES: hypothetical protein [Pseudomonas]|uniref:hypothetical protein n=1 Tax=Pseudomonas TaxID=286 RepID=UPI000F575F75|nr:MULTISPECIES: hypothetical protein [Pseudomonas]KAB0532946.1 hypothetical protein F7R16_10645 [Pseudomonas chlororaphis subsp. aureofaciens]TSD26112.1 hypothetical protein FCE86_032145 [Pseudomonas sp. ATCC 13985]WDG57942.1 hypothetical protein PUP52_19040 [Pseudomonas chlororaphis]WDG64155.1 hypothetical protein PUP59_19045 [Pseudomonas chlororaphis]
MEEEISFEHEGTIYTCSYLVQGDDLIVYLPDGSQRETTLRGLGPETTALNHLRGFVLHSKKASLVDR